MKKIILLISLLLPATAGAQVLSGTYLFAQRDTCDLYMDVYAPAQDAVMYADSLAKPTIVYVFGGGFIIGRRNDPFILPWVKTLTDNGYRVVCTDYRLGLKGKSIKFDLINIINSAKATKEAVDIGVDDTFAAIRYLCDNAEELGIDPDNIVISGSSAGAMISLSCALETCSPTVRTKQLPEGFRFKGVMSFAGAIMSDSGMPKYGSEPAPHLLFHGTEDGAVAYDKTAFGRFGLYGSSSLVRDIFSRNSYPYAIYRYSGHGHDIAAHMLATWPEQKLFLERNVVQGLRRTVDASVDDPAVPVWSKLTISVKDIY